MFMMHSIKKQSELTGSNHKGLNLFASSLNWGSYAYLMKSTADLKTTLKCLLHIHPLFRGLKPNSEKCVVMQLNYIIFWDVPV